MRIAIMMSAHAVNGAAVHCLLLARFLAGRGHAVLLLHRPEAWIAGQPGLEGVEKFATSFARRPGELLRVDEKLGAFGAEVVHTHMSSAHSYGAATRLFNTIPVVATAHATHFQLHWALNHFIIAASEQARDYHIRRNLVRPAKIAVIPNFIDLARFPAPTPQARAAARAAFGLAEEAFVVGSVGDLIARKRPVDLVRAFAPLGRARAEARLMLVGGHHAPVLAEVKQVAAALGVAEQLVLPGMRPDVPRALAAMDVFAHASGHELGPLAILEASASGLPVLATRIGMVPDFVPEGRSGHLHAVGAVDEMGAQMRALAEDPARRAALGAAGRAHVAANYSVEGVAPRIEAVLEKVARRRNRPPFGFATAIARALRGRRAP